MPNQRPAVDPAAYQPLLSLIGKVESNDNYDAYYGNAGNKEIKFSAMPIAEVLSWQDSFVAAGNPSSAVGRYQIINTTLAGLVHELSIDSHQKFDPPTQDRMAIALLERRGSIDYAARELTPHEFAANLAKEWAGLPRVVGDTPNDSYYAGDGLNAAHTSVDEVLQAIKHIKN